MPVLVKRAAAAVAAVASVVVVAAAAVAASAVAVAVAAAAVAVAAATVAAAADAAVTELFISREGGPSGPPFLFSRTGMDPGWLVRARFPQGRMAGWCRGQGKFSE